jgi:threonylcarbamoyladenosine tRNA methylthiotransferase MtaB
MPGQVPAEVRRERMAEMLEVADAAQRAFLRARIGRRETVLWERPKGGLAQGLTGTYIRVTCPTSRDLRNRFADVRVTALAAGGGAVRGELIDGGPPPAGTLPERTHPPCT